MKSEVTNNKVNVQPSFKAGDVIALKVPYEDSRISVTEYYFIGSCSDLYCYYLFNIDTGGIVIINDNGKKDITISKEIIAALIKHNHGKVYSGNKAKLIIEEIKINKQFIPNISKS